MSLLSALAAWLPLQTDPSATVCGGHEAGRGPTVVLWGWGSHHSGEVGSVPQWGRSPGRGNVLALKIPWTQEHDRLQSIELQTVRHN